MEALGTVGYVELRYSLSQTIAQHHEIVCAACLLYVPCINNAIRRVPALGT
jgi:hypothetical protein